MPNLKYYERTYQKNIIDRQLSSCAKDGLAQAEIQPVVAAGEKKVE